MSACTTITQPSETEIGRTIEAPEPVVIAGDVVNTDLLKRFYAHHDFGPVWASRPEQAKAIIATVAHADEQGLNPALFHADALKHESTLSSLERELLLSDAALAYADAMARGAVPVERRSDSEALTPGPVDSAAKVGQALDDADPGATLDALAPTTATYRALRKALQACRTARAADKRKNPDCVRRVEVNLERQRWLPRTLPADRVMVNVADERLVYYHDDQPVFSTRVIVGQDVERNQSPEFQAVIDASLFNPPWVVPKDIVTREILPKIHRDPNYLARNKMIMLANGEVEQMAGPEAGLGLLMFDMPNRFDVYLHDTPDRSLFNRINRRISHGCIRVQNPRELAALLLKEPVSAVDQGIATGTTTRNVLPTGVPVFVIYQTAFVDEKGVLRYAPDFYNRDPALWKQLNKAPRRARSSTLSMVPATVRHDPRMAFNASGSRLF
ncbi:peptidoglycan binding protein [Ameyamaea chiangmaiensis NBRC 103196]|uniref:L,D-transpeptidase family protein n=1 Tax=Ameyamaea chiangmaiensis TaxID=442969 RepID=A0A850PBD1_9PROT|nr:L,D-transpeptidase family protein [Ameyamaea chiangmaiensis]MBS4075105.1 L,D-transpeptidase family protein [Ameyamaea chiangmaiensis]NVN41394.1 L,D-transpeptidase family protein [Ameyamaea chiangmaiensis]GBQ66068.1 peptidoglycan binding protein [Ameyamaea chiangmaiensis NBRC 103196]